MDSIWKNHFDLAPGDQESKSFPWDGLDVKRIESESDPLFSLAYGKLWEEFGTKGELETQEVLARRMKWNPQDVRDGFSFFYEMVLILKNDRFVAVRDHTAIVCHNSSPAEAFVHLSHVVIDPAFRGTGLIGWLRAWPIQTARKCLQASSLLNGKITLVAEMEPPHPEKVDRAIRLKSYGKAGFLKTDPRVIDFYQPDFRSPQEIDVSGGPQPMALQLVIRRVERETETEMPGAEVKRMVAALYQIYGREFRPQDMAVVWSHLKTKYPGDAVLVKLIDPRVTHD